MCLNRLRGWYGKECWSEYVSENFLCNLEERRINNFVGKRLIYLVFKKDDCVNAGFVVLCFYWFWF